jgi:hypothetical protein
MSTAIERRSTPRTQLLAPVRVRPAEIISGPVEIVGGLSNFSTNSVHLFMERYAKLKRAQLIVRLANQFDPSFMREFMVEVVREEALQNGRFAIAAKILHNIQLKLRDGLLLPESGLWNTFPLVTPTSLNIYA